MIGVCSRNVNLDFPLFCLEELERQLIGDLGDAMLREHLFDYTRCLSCQLQKTHGSKDFPGVSSSMPPSQR